MSSEQAAANVWSYLPEVVRVEDATPRPGTQDVFRKYVDAAADMSGPVYASIAEAEAGQWIDPAATPAGLVPWLARLLGVNPAGETAAVRARIAARKETPAIGSRQSIAAFVRQYLTGSQQVIVVPDPPWKIVLGVRAEEVAGSLADLTEKVDRAGIIPAGFAVEAIAVAPTWQQITDVITALSGGAWSGIPSSMTWSQIDSLGVDLDG